MEKIKYKKGYKYQLAEDYVCQVDIKPLQECKSEYIDLDKKGKMTIHKGYAWDGPSGPTIDTKNFMRGALVHDALYQLIREGKLLMSDREQADIELKKAVLEDGMSWLRAFYVFRSVRRMAKYAASPKNKKKVIVAP